MINWWSIYVSLKGIGLFIFEVFGLFIFEVIGKIGGISPPHNGLCYDNNNNIKVGKNGGTQSPQNVEIRNNNGWIIAGYSAYVMIIDLICLFIDYCVVCN